MQNHLNNPKAAMSMGQSASADKDAMARKNGYKNYQEMLLHAKARTRKPAKQAPAKTAPVKDSKAMPAKKKSSGVFNIINKALGG